MSDEKLMSDKLELACSLLGQVDALLSPAGGSEMTALRGLLQHAKMRLEQMPENDFALRLAQIAQNQQN